jgi:hypothetical protein
MMFPRRLLRKPIVAVPAAIKVDIPHRLPRFELKRPRRPLQVPRRQHFRLRLLPGKRTLLAEGDDIK